MELDKENVEKLVDEKVQAARGMFWQYRDKYKWHAVTIVGILVFLIGVYFYSNYAARQKVEEFANGLKQQWSEQNKSLLDNIYQIQQDQMELKENFRIQSEQLENIKKQRRKEWQNIKTSKDPKVISNYFDNQIDQYVPER